MTAAGTDVVASAEALRGTADGQDWVADGLRAGGGMAALDATMRPIDALASAGHGWLTPHVQPFQDVLDRLAGNASVIQSFADARQRAAGTVDQVQQQLARSAPAATQQWQALAGTRPGTFAFARSRPLARAGTFAGSLSRSFPHPRAGAGTRARA